MKSSNKSQTIEELINTFMGKNRIETIEAGLCMTCDEPNTRFIDELSSKEYTISGLCQDRIFGEDEFDISQDITDY